jgi:hypothetical protein
MTSQGRYELRNHDVSMPLASAEAGAPSSSMSSAEGTAAEVAAPTAVCAVCGGATSLKNMTDTGQDTAIRECGSDTHHLI